MTTRPEFDFHKLNEKGIGEAKAIAHLFSGLLDELESIIGSSGREIAIARTKLEEAAFFAKKAMAVRVENQA